MARHRNRIAGHPTGYSEDELKNAYHWLGREPEDKSMPINVKVAKLSLEEEALLRAAIVHYTGFSAEITPLPSGDVRVCVYGDRG